ncbi:MAG: hypothetical protein JKY87_03575 [Mariprofundus sp.]|nr:hypothetical protein [Mariprofundus sp.]
MIIVISMLSIPAIFLLLQPALACADLKTDKTAPITLKNNASNNDTSNDKKALETTTIKKVNVDVLKKRLRKTKAIGFFTKLTIRSDLLDLMRNIKRYRKKSILNDKLTEVRISFDGLLLKIIALLDQDPDLSRDLYVGREMIWQSLLEEKA